MSDGGNLGISGNSRMDTRRIRISDFEKVDIRIGTILSAELNPKAKTPALVLEIDFGPLGIKTSSAQITDHYQPKELPGSQVAAVMNFEMKRIAGVKSEVLVMGADDPEGVVLLSPRHSVPNGSRVY